MFSYSFVAREHPIADELRFSSLGIVPVSEKHHGIPGSNGYVASSALRTFNSRIINDSYIVTRHRPPHETRLWRVQSTARRNDHVTFSLPVELIDGHSESVATPLEQFRPKRFSAACHAAHGKIQGSIEKRRVSHHFQRGRRNESVLDLELFDQTKCFRTGELLETICDDRNSVMQGGKENIQQSSDPGPICRRPKAIPGLGNEIMTDFNARQMPEEYSVGM